jgi:hypothetical protein
MPGSFVNVIKKDSRPYIESLRDDIAQRRDPDFFWPTGTQVYCGRQGSGKTVSAVKHLIDLKERYPKALIVSNIQLSKYRALSFLDKQELLAIREVVDPKKDYIYFSDMEQLALALVEVNNGRLGVIYIIDEIHTYFNALESKNIPMYVFTEISQQRKQRKLIVGTSQLFLRMAKPLREQCDNLIMCSTFGGILTVQRAYDGMTLTQDYDGSLSGNMKKIGWFVHNRKIRESFDTFQKVVSGAQQYEEINRLEITGKFKKAFK